ncbi:DNA/RNA helicase domain-containing protein [Emticicia sp. W12TSBA100-4]|uniref:DNA/RNA helicase domain-containing protein n=1 Tax=Emticicia sp. W12TSBA100-4 TaxID=3160965 RepID=UPI0033056339
MGAFYHTTLQHHQATPTDQIVGTISLVYSDHHLDQKQQQTKTWADSVEIIKQFFDETKDTIFDLGSWGILYEYKIPRRAKRIDVVLISNNLIFVLEVKNHQNNFNLADSAQLEDYCLDLRDFHFESKDRIIIPILLCTNAQSISNEISKSNDIVQNTIFANSKNLSEIIHSITNLFADRTDNINFEDWNNSKYSPTPTIIEAAQVLYAGQNVSEISRSHAGAENLTSTTNAVIDAIKQAKRTKSKIICFITGVPGAGKTLAGLNIVHNRDFQSDNSELGVFLSGNSPLVKVLSEALSRDFSKREDVNKVEAKRRVKTFIHNVHEFIDAYYLDKTKTPFDRVLIYDEAQRAWTKEHKTKKSNGEITESEPEVLLSIMNRHDDWSVIIALVGGGQEINTGEAGLREWGKAIEDKFTNWKVYISQELKQGDHSTGNLTLFETIPKNVEVVENENLHLKVSIRSYKAQELSKWVGLVLENKSEEASKIFNDKLKHYPIFITRNLDTAKNWLKKKARGTRRIGIVASSGGRRLKAFGYDPFYGLRGDSSQDELGAWYLNPTDDVRSSNFLEIIATEYAVQGLEIDWAGIFWDTDLRRENGNWSFRQFKGTKWQTVADEQRKQFILNKYRVLLTRAREGAIIWVPNGDDNDKTRLSIFYNDIFDYLKSCGLKEI